MAQHINRVIITGNLTKDPELRATGGGTPVCSLRIASNSRRKDSQSGEWVDKPNFFDVTVFGRQGENAAQYLSKGRPVGIDGRLEWREWQAQDGSKRSAVGIVAESVQFLGDGGAGQGGGAQSRGGAPAVDDFAPAPVAAGAFGQSAPDDDIPF